MAQCCGARRCTCTVTAGPGVTVTGDGGTTSPYVISADGGGTVSCDDVRPCLSAGDGVDYDPVTGVISARPSADAGNTLAFGADGGLLVPPPTAPPLATDCGLTGDGSAGDPLAVAAQAWPYPCDVDDNAGGVYCDSAGQLRSEPRGIYDFTQQHIVTDYPTSPLVPSATNTVVLTRDFVVDNPDPCREAAMFVELEVDIDFDLPAGSGAAGGIATDSMQYIANRGTSAATDVHQQSTKVYNELPIPAGGSTTVTLNVSLGRGSGGAMFNRIQTFIRCFVIVL